MDLMVKVFSGRTDVELDSLNSGVRSIRDRDHEIRYSPINGILPQVDESTGLFKLTVLMNNELVELKNITFYSLQMITGDPVQDMCPLYSKILYHAYHEITKKFNEQAKYPMSKDREEYEKECEVVTECNRTLHEELVRLFPGKLKELLQEYTLEDDKDYLQEHLNGLKH